MEKNYLVIAAVMMVMGQLILKAGMERVGEVDLIKSGIVHSFLAIFLNPVVVLGLVIYFVSCFLYLVSISKLDLSFAYPVIISISYISIPLLSYFLFKEKITTSQVVLLGVIFICLILFYRIEK